MVSVWKWLLNCSRAAESCHLLLCSRTSCGIDSHTCCITDSKANCGDTPCVLTFALGSWHLPPSFGNAITSIFTSQASPASSQILGFTYSIVTVDGCGEDAFHALYLPIASFLNFHFRSSQICRMLTGSTEKEG